MTDAPTHAERFAAVVAPAAKAAGYYGHGAQARLAREIGMSESSVSRMLKGQAVPDIKFIDPLAEALGLDAIDLLVHTGLLPRKYLQSQPETDRSPVRSRTSDDVADEFGITDVVGRHMLAATIERLVREEQEGDGVDDSHGGTAAQR
jgi:transcriptional regulator with XRE-family HTH domain